MTHKKYTHWTLFEKVWLLSFVGLSILFYFLLDDTLLGLVTSVSGIVCVVLVAKGDIRNFYAGIVMTACYAYMSYNQKYYGEVMLNAGYFFPMQFVGLYLWSKDKGTTGERITVLFLSNQLRMIYALASVLLIVVYGFILKRLDGELPFIDASSTILSVIAMFLMTKRYMEQWILWIIINVITIIMWVIAYQKSGNDSSMIVMWTAYLANSIYGLVNWISMHKKQLVYA